MSDAGALRSASPEMLRQLVGKLRRQLEARGRGGRSVVIGVRAQPQWTFGELGTDDGHRIAVAPCATPLLVREALASYEADPGAENGTATLVVLSDLSDNELGADVLSRFLRPRLLNLDPWQAVMQRLGVRQLDPDFADSSLAWLAGALLEVPREFVPRGLSILSVDTALRAISRQVLGVQDLTLDRLIAATAAPGFSDLVRTADADTLAQLCDALGRRLGPAGALATGAIAVGHGADVLPAGLAATAAGTDMEGQYLQAQIEGFTGVTKPTNAAFSALARAAEAVFAEIELADPTSAAEIVVAATGVCARWNVPHPELSDVLPAGYNTRLAHLAALLDQTFATTSSVNAGAIRQSVESVKRHREYRLGTGRHRGVRAALAARLALWLQRPDAQDHGVGPTSSTLLPDIISCYACDGAWVDAARRRVAEGDDAVPEMTAALAKVSEAAHGLRATGNERFARSLADWTRHGRAEDLNDTTVVPVEQILQRIVGPLAKTTRVLLVVLDGCGLPQFLEFAHQFRDLGLQEIAKKDGRLVGLAALPTVTEVSRASLLSGELVVGDASLEKRRFAEHPAISSPVSGPAALYHQHQDMDGSAGYALPANVAAALGSDGPQVVGAVVNTIDDELSHGTFNRDYRIENLGPLQALLRTAAAAGRCVVVTADHGHVLGVGLDGRGSTRRDPDSDGGNRWRVAEREPDADEVRLLGPRVLKGDEQGVLAPWADDLRYATKQGGYHGGATPDECLVPLSVFRPPGVEVPAGWEPIAVAPPAWWDLADRLEDAAPSPTPARKTRRPAAAATHDPLFVVPEPTATAAPAEAAPEWVEQLLSSDNFKLQVCAVTRARPTDDRVRAALTAVGTRGGVASFAAVASATGLAPARVGGFLNILKQILNLDMVAVLVVDPDGEEVRLNQQLLAAQFLGGTS